MNSSDNKEAKKTIAIIAHTWRSIFALLSYDAMIVRSLTVVQLSDVEIISYKLNIYLKKK